MQIREVVPFSAGLPEVLPLLVLVFLSLDTRSVIFLFSGVRCRVFVENMFFYYGQIFVNVCRITVFSIQKYSSFTGRNMCRVSKKTLALRQASEESDCFVAFNYKNRYTCKFKSSQKNESRKQSDSSEACCKAKVFLLSSIR